MDTKIFVVTGVTSGIGRALALDLAKTGETVVLVARDPDRGNAVREKIAAVTQNPNVDLQLADLSSLSSVRNVAEILKSKYKSIDVLINNAAIYKRKRETSIDGYEMMFATNHLGPFLLTNLVLELLQASVQASGSARILNITAPSTTQLNFDDLQGEGKFTSLNAFGATKMANLLFTFELAHRLADTGITVNAIHPGLARSRLMQETFLPLRFISWLASSPPEKVTESIIEAATAPEFQTINGKLLHNGKEMEVPAYAHDRGVQQRLWNISEALTGVSSTKGVLPVS